MVVIHVGDGVYTVYKGVNGGVACRRRVYFRISLQLPMEKEI
jgi:hypothetical protein